jgi:ribosomal protein L29
VKPSENQGKSSVSQANNNSVSLKLTKPEITANPNELIDIEVFQHWLDNQDSNAQTSFNAFAKDSFSVVESYLYARFLGYKGPISSCEAWLRAHYPKPDHLKVLLFEIAEMQEDIRRLREDIENFAVKRDAGVARIAGMQKELRGTIAQVNTFVSAKDQKSLMLAGADRAISELCTIFKDDAFENVLQEAALSVWAKIQHED